jgi:hypothetical protein
MSQYGKTDIPSFPTAPCGRRRSRCLMYFCRDLELLYVFSGLSFFKEAQVVDLRILNVAVRSENGVSRYNLMSSLSYPTERAGASFDCRINAPKVDKSHIPFLPAVPLSLLEDLPIGHTVKTIDDLMSHVDAREAYFVSASLVLLSHFPRHYFSGCRHRHVLLAPKLRW